ncbi:MAG: aminotransferase class IV [Candidatus Rhabdochlamydia sp.]
MCEGLCFFNDQWILLSEAKLPLTDLSITRGYAIFDYLRTYHRRPFHLADHLQRLKKSADQVHLTLPYSFEHITALIHEGIAQTSFAEVSIKILLTAGGSQDHFFPENCPQFCIIMMPLPSVNPAHKEQGIHVITTRLLRVLPQVKSTCYLSALIALHQVKKHQVDDAVYVNAQEEILEGLTSNIFAVRQGCLITPESLEILPGITREIVKQCALPDIPVKIEPLPLAHFKDWDEMFITSSTKEVMPIVTFDHAPIGKGKVGPYTQEMIRRFHLYTQNKCPPV